MGSCHSTLDIRYIFVVKTIESAKNFLFRILGRNASCDVISIVSDEQAYIAEFVHHYLYLGFSNIYLGINNSSDRTYAIIHKISEKYKNVIPINVDKQFWLGRQEACYMHLFELARQSSLSSHALFVDVDEFWVADPFPKKVSEFLAGKEQYDCISFSWINCFDEKAFSPPLTKCKRKVNPHVKSIVAYKSAVLTLRPHAPVFRKGRNIRTLAGIQRNQNQICTDLGVEICQKLQDESIAKPRQRNLAWVFHRIQRSELEYTCRLFKVHANETQEQPYFKSNRPGFRTPNIEKKFKKAYRKILPNEQIFIYHLSLSEFLKANGIESLVTDSILEMSEEQLWIKIKSIPQEVISRDFELIKRIFSGTRFREWLLQCLNRNNSTRNI